MSTDKRFSIFISSTFEDLKEERQAVQDAVLSAGDFPVQMESFPAADQDQFEFIKTLIDKCDYYVLIVAGRYGTPAADGISYTEKEYHYARSRDIPVLVMLHGDPGSIPAAKTESTDEGKARLSKFIQEIQNGRLRKTWTTAGDLKHAVREALDNVKATRPAVGWVRGDTTASAAILNEINEVRKENAKFRDAIGHLEIELALPPVPEPDTPLEIDLMPRSKQEYGSPVSSTYARIRCTWISAFPSFYSNLDWRTYDYSDEYYYSIDVDASCMAIGSSLAAELATFDTSGLYKITPNTFERLKSYFIETGLMVTSGESPFTESGNRAARRHRIADAGKHAFEERLKNLRLSA
ncbi:hypothetical protein C6W92_13130 [Roseovarius sp. A46]|uniref:DUF4062 domain-containing protein n=1 Tax=Roseovarius sp. A46 TaxID=2109331 RepID=UPI0010132D3B|nr:DUF4062 domain-containing protein [Roseovarius sp. A46]RXV60821.1 hypothetical protein C6W92_13130 [Roseovarius sp. A46]